MLIIAYVQGNIVVIDRIMYPPIPSRVAIAEVRLAHELSIRHIDQSVRDRDTDLHILDLVAPLLLVRPPNACPYAFARGVNPGVTCGILPESKTTEPARLGGGTGVVEVNGIGLAGTQCLREIDKNRPGVALVVKLVVA